MTFADAQAKAVEYLGKADDALKGEPARFIGYGSAIVVTGVVLVANAVGITRFGGNIDLVTALGLTATATTTVVGVIESIRHFVTPVSKT